MRDDAIQIINKTISDVLPDKIVKEAIQQLDLKGEVYVVAIGKAAWIMAHTASQILNDQIKEGIIVTKYDHSRGEINKFEIIESGHPIPDENSVLGARKIIEMFDRIPQTATVLMLISGGGSSLVELCMPGITLNDIQDVTEQMLKCGANILEINVLRKKLSAIKGGKLSGYLKGQKQYSIILSDIIGGRDDMIASGLTYPDKFTRKDVEAIINKYQLKLPEAVMQIIRNCKPVETVAVENHVIGSVDELCRAAARHAEELGYCPHIVSTSLQCEACEASRWIIEECAEKFVRPCAIIAGGETVVIVKGDGLGGRNQEIALSGAKYLSGQKDVLLFSLGSDGTDGPTDAAGGIVDGDSLGKLEFQGIDVDQVLQKNDSYHALEKIDGLIKTGATGTNVNDVTVLLKR